MLTLATSAALLVACAATVVLLTNVHSHGPAPAAVVADQGSGVAPAPATSPSSASAVPSTASNPLPVGPLTYTVKPGDSLTTIAAWFHLRGYGPLYDANKDVIGKDPGLIHPGQIITISAQGITVG